MKKKWMRASAAVAAVFCVLLVLQMLAGAAGPCSLTVRPCDPSNEEMTKELLGKGLVFDLYKVAGMQASQPAGSYAFTADPDFPDVKIGEDITNAGWQQIAQSAADKIFRKDGQILERPNLQPDVSGQEIGGKAEGLEEGIYLIIAHEKDAKPQDYVTLNEAGKLVTRFRGEDDLYTFMPELVAVPTKEAVDGVIRTDNPGEWIKDVTVNLKPGVNDALGSIRITKRLLSYEGSERVTFVFQVRAERDGKQVYDRVASIDFSGPGTQTIQLNDLPVGSKVTVEEIYSGASCTLKERIDPSDPTVNVEAPIEFVFVNDFDKPNQGHGLLNRFVYVKGEGESSGHWELIRSEAEGGEEV